jgi:hypothetical protein
MWSRYTQGREPHRVARLAAWLRVWRAFWLGKSQGCGEARTGRQWTA